MINREDMLELTRRMTPARNHFDRIAGAYIDRDGDFDGSFNTHFQKLQAREKEKMLSIAKAVPFSRTNEELKRKKFPGGNPEEKALYQLLYGLLDCGLKNDALLDSLYDYIMERHASGRPYGILVFHGMYDIPRKSSAGEYQYESEEVYNYIICAVCPLAGEYESGEPEAGFIFPAFSDRSADFTHIDIYRRA